jgi:hypothetical protein
LTHLLFPAIAVSIVLAVASISFAQTQLTPDVTEKIDKLSPLRGLLHELKSRLRR